MNPGNAQVESSELRDLVFHQCDEGRDDKRGATESDGGELIAERLPCPGRHDQEQVTSLDGGAADRFLVGAKARESKNGVQKLGEVFRIGESGQVAAEPSEDKKVPSPTLQKRGGVRGGRGVRIK